MNETQLKHPAEDERHRPAAPTRIAQEFGVGAASSARQVVGHLYSLLAGSPSDETRRCFDGWLDCFSEALGIDATGDVSWAGALASHYEVDADDPAKLLFAVHTYYALVIKLLAVELLVGLDDKLLSRPERLSRRLQDPCYWESLGPANLTEGDLFFWYIEQWNSRTAEAVSLTAAGLTGYGDVITDGNPHRHRDLLKPLYSSLVPSKVRHGVGEYYTPDWLAELALDEVNYDGDPNRRLLDPACGSGTFIVCAINRIKKWIAGHGDQSGYERHELREQIVDGVAGFDLNPLAVLACRVNYLAAICEFIDPSSGFEIPIYRRNAIAPPRDTKLANTADLVVSNPPWINWQNLPESRRETTKKQWEDYGLFSLSGSRGRLGGGKKDLSMLFTYACCDHYLKNGGELGFLMPRSVFKSKGAGDGFRRFRYDRDGETIHLAPTEVHDYTAFQPFEGATTQTVFMSLKKQRRPVKYPVPYWIWEKKGRGKIGSDTSVADAQERMSCIERAARPVDPDHDASPWLTAPPEAIEGIMKVIGNSDYRAYEGVNSGGLNGCYWVREIQRTIDGYTVVENLHDVGRIKVEKRRCEVESERVFPLLRSGDIERWAARPMTSIILGQDPETRSGIDESTMRNKYPKIYDYFRHFEGDPDDVRRGTLRGRSLFRRYFKPSDPFYSMYGVGPYTMSTWKVCWTRIDTRLRASVVGPDDEGRVVLPQETITFVPTEDAEEAHYFCALFNSTPSDALVRCYSTGKGFASAHVLKTVAVPRFDRTDKAHIELVELSRTCHALAEDGAGDRLRERHLEIDRRAALIWDLSDEELRGIQNAFPV